MIGVYFEKRRALANGIAVAGASVGQLLIPLLMNFLIKNYDVSGALVIYAAVHLNGLVAAMLLRPPHFYARWGHYGYSLGSTIPRGVIFQIIAVLNN